MTSAPLLEQFVGTRAELKSQSEDVTLFGWVKAVITNQIIIHFPAGQEFQRDDSFEIILSCHNASTKFFSKYLGLAGEIPAFETPMVVRLSPASGVLRKQSPIKSVQITSATINVSAVILDIARVGFAIQTNESFEQGQKVSAEFVTPDGSPMQMDVVVVYCRFDQDSQLFRVGFEHKSLGRIDQARWQILLATDISEPAPSRFK